MPSKRTEKPAPQDQVEQNVELPLSLYLSFAEAAGIGLKPCGIDGQPLPGASGAPLVGPCAALCDGALFSPVCAANHAGIIKTVIELRRPNIFNCHMGLAAWAVPILHEGRPLPAAIICGGALLTEPDSALKAHFENVAEKHGVDPAELARSLDSVPVLSRDRLRAIAEFLFQMSAAFTSLASPSDEPAADTSAEAVEPQQPVSHPRRKKETKKARLARSRLLERQNLEAEVARLLMERRPDAALAILREILVGTGDVARGGRAANNLAAAETFTRLFRMLGEGRTIPRGAADKQSLLIAETLSRKDAAATRDTLDKACRAFIAVAEEITGEHRPRKVKAVQRYLEKNFSKKLTLGAVGKRFDLKEKALDALMRKHFGMGFIDYVTLIRVSEAKRLLSTTDLNMSDIARKTGFKDQSYFTKVFKSRVGSTPTEFQKAKQE
jgi:two-component system response regulator YesN